MNTSLSVGADARKTEWFLCDDRDVSPGDQLPGEVLEVMLGAWEKLSEDGEIPEAGKLDIMDFWEGAGWLHYLEVVDGGADFRYRVYGSGVVGITNLDMTGKYVSEQPGPVSDKIMHSYRRVLKNRGPLLSYVRADGDVIVRDWVRLSLPFAENGEVTRILCAARPVSRTSVASEPELI